MSHANPSTASHFRVMPCTPDAGAFDRLVQTDTRLREVVQRVSDRLLNVLPPAPASIQCSPPGVACPEPMRAPLTQIVYELNLAIDRLEGIISRVDL